MSQQMYDRRMIKEANEDAMRKLQQNPSEGSTILPVNHSINLPLNNGINNNNLNYNQMPNIPLNPTNSNLNNNPRYTRK